VVVAGVVEGKGKRRKKAREEEGEEGGEGEATKVG
jgi:hypothetical protein